MIAAQAPHPFDRLHLCEKNKKRYGALNSRVLAARSDSEVIQGDANDKIHDIVADIPEGVLSLAFLDPFGLHLDYQTLRVLSKIRADLIIFFPDRVDALRNWENHYLENQDSNLDHCLGYGADWRAKIDETPREHLAEVLRDMYVSQIKHLGYRYFEYQRISTQNHPLYILIFCSRHPVAAKIWRGISSKQPDGQRTFPFQ